MLPKTSQKNLPPLAQRMNPVIPAEAVIQILLTFFVTFVRFTYNHIEAFL